MLLFSLFSRRYNVCNAIGQSTGKVEGEVGSRGAGQPTPPFVKVRVRKVSESLCSVSKVENKNFYMYRKFNFYS